MTKLSKNIRKELQKLSNKVYQTQLDEELSKLEEGFEDWRNDKIDCFELSNKIHRFHNGPARELWKRYNRCKDQLSLVAYAIVEGHLQESEISDETMKELKSIIHFYREY